MKVGRLRFEAHGFLGVASLALVAYALARPSSPSRVAASVVATTLLACGSLSLIATAPLNTTIAPGVDAPHRAAFSRTIAVCLYINLRLAWAHGWWDDLLQWGGAAGGVASPRPPLSARCAYGACVLAWATWLAPRHALANGNTWIFVVPIFAGVGADAAHQLLSLGVEAGFFGSDDEHAWRRRGSAWNERVATVELMLGIQLALLLLAFGFTLAFRRYLDVRALYAAAAGIVAAILARLSGARAAAAVATGVAAHVALYRWICVHTRSGGHGGGPPPTAF